MNGDNEQCFFKDVLGMDRIIKQQSFPDTQQNNTLYSLPFPKKGETGSCNIVILGYPGTGKSTLALEMAMGLRVLGLDKKGVVNENPSTVIYFSLEENRNSLIKRAYQIDKNKGSKRAFCTEGPENPAENYECKSDNNKTNLVLFPILSPRPLEQIRTSEEALPHEPSIFWKRMGEIRNLVENLEALYENKIIPKLRMVIIDSLNVFGDTTITRYLADQLFSFFSDRGLIGAFIAEDFDSSRMEINEKPLLSIGIVNLADVAIRMSWKTEEGYAFRNIEIVKSRNTPNVYGAQQMKIRQSGIEIFPSLHSWYTYLHTIKTGKKDESKTHDHKLNEFYSELISDYDKNKDLQQNKENLNSISSLVYLVSGKKEKGKSSLGWHFAATGVNHSNTDEKFLIVNFDEPFSNLEYLVNVSSFPYKLRSDKSSEYDPLKKILQGTKGHIERIQLIRNENVYRGYELWLTPGYLLPEEFVYFLYQLLRSKVHSQITRVVLRDVGELPMRHPILAQKIISGGSNYIPVILELFNCLNIDCMFVCSVDDDADSKAIERGLSAISHYRIYTEAPPNAEEKEDSQSQKNDEDSARTYWLKGRFIKKPIKMVLKNMC